MEFTEKWLPTYIRRDLTVLFCGINPGRVSATAGFHYANPANLFWRGLFEGGLTARQLLPEETSLLLDYNYGITDLVTRPTRSSSDLTREDFDTGAEQFVHMIQTYRPRVICFNGITAFRHATGQKKPLSRWVCNQRRHSLPMIGQAATCSSSRPRVEPTPHSHARNASPNSPS